MNYLSNAFSLSMIPHGGTIVVLPIPEHGNLSDIYSSVIWTSIVGHADTAKLFEQALEEACGFFNHVPVNRTSVRLQPGDSILVGQYVGPRLPEGTTKLPEGARINWMLVFMKF